jgi:hypothetical protein
VVSTTDILKLRTQYVIYAFSSVVTRIMVDITASSITKWGAGGATGPGSGVQGATTWGQNEYFKCKNLFFCLKNFKLVSQVNGN